MRFLKFYIAKLSPSWNSTRLRLLLILLSKVCAVFKIHIAKLRPSLNSTRLRLFLILLYPAPNNLPELIVIVSVFGAKLEDGLIFLQIGRRPLFTNWKTTSK